MARVRGDVADVGVFGGAIGAYAGRAVFRHKTRKQPFSSHLHQTAILHVFAAALAGRWMLAGAL